MIKQLRLKLNGMKFQYLKKNKWIKILVIDYPFILDQLKNADFNCFK